jgi:subtilase family serine protease
VKLSDRLRASARLATAVALGAALSLGSAAAADAASPSAAARLMAAEAAGSAHASQPALTAANSTSSHACSAVIVVGKQSCFALKRAGIHPMAASVSPNAIPAGVGYGPTQLQSAYNLTSASAADGSGRTVALVDAFDDPSAASDLATYRSAAGLPAANFTKVNQNGQTSPLPAEAPASDDWTLEESLDLDMVSSICPLCSIVLVEANDDTSNGLYVAENTAAGMAGYISNSWGGAEASSDLTLDSQNFNHPGDVITASAGDSDYGVIYPATSPNVVSVGGTSLSTASNSRGWTESVWNTTPGSEGTGSGCSAFEPEPSWQSALGLPAGCSNRIDNDTSADADPNTGVAVYDTSNGDGGWNEVGGTSASSPMVAAMYALAGNPGNTPADDIYTHTSNFFDVTSGNDGSCSPAYLCTAGVGYDGPTGIGTPDGIAGLQTGTTTGNTVTVTNPGSQTGSVGTAVSLQIHATDSASGQTLTYSATGLPAGLSISSSSGLISGTPTTAATSSVTVTVTDTTGASGSAAFTWTISTPGGGGCSTSGNIVKNPTFSSGTTSWTSTPSVIGQWAPSEPPFTGTWDAWLDGYGSPHTDTLSQSVTVPTGCSGTLEVWLHIDSTQTSGTNGSFTIKVGSTTLATFTNLNAASGYTEHTYAIPSSAVGSAVTLLFTGVENNSNNTSYVVGQVLLNVA